jgi:hypothetical protein
MSQGTQTTPQGNGLAVAALVLGLLGLLLAVATGWIPCVGLFLPLIPTLLAVIFGFVGRGRASQGAPHGGVATAGLACGIIGLLFTIGFQIFWGAAVGTAVKEAGGIQGLQQQMEEGMQKSMEELQKEMEAEQKKIELQIEEEKKKTEALPPAGTVPAKATDPSGDVAPKKNDNP